MLNILELVKCGSIEIEPIIPSLVYYVVTAIKIFIPIVLIVFGMLDLAKAVTSNDDKAMKEAQGKLIKRVIYAVLIFLVVSIVTTIFSILGKAQRDAGENTTVSCIDCFFNNNCAR